MLKGLYMRVSRDVLRAFSKLMYSCRSPVDIFGSSQLLPQICKANTMVLLVFTIQQKLNVRCVVEKRDGSSKFSSRALSSANGCKLA